MSEFSVSEIYFELASILKKFEFSGIYCIYNRLQ